MTKRAAQQAYAKAGVKPSDVQVVELHGRWKEKVRTKKNEKQDCFCQILSNVW